MLSNTRGVIGVGELTNLERLGGGKNEYCFCGTRVNDCKFWDKVKIRVSKEGYFDIIECQLFKREVKGHKKYFNSYLQGKNDREILEQYKQYNCVLLSAIATESEAKVIVDSSKLPSRAFFLSLMDTFDVYLLHIVRDPRAVCWSLKKPYKKDLAKGIQNDMPGRRISNTVRSWLGNSLFALRIKKHSPAEYMVINYDRLIKETSKVLDEVSQLTGVDFSSVAEMIHHNQEFRKFHTVAGKRL